MRAFIPGGNGFIGSRLAQQLAARGDTVVCLVRDPAKVGTNAASPAASPNIHWVKGDITERARLTKPMRGADVVYHLAGLYRYGHQYLPQSVSSNRRAFRIAHSAFRIPHSAFSIPYMPFIHTIDPTQAVGALKREYDAAMARAGRIWNIVRLMSLNPETLRASMRLYAATMKGECGLTRAQRELLAVIVSQTNGCHY